MTATDNVVQLELRPTIEVRPGEFPAVVTGAVAVAVERSRALLAEGRRDGVTFSQADRPVVLDMLTDNVGGQRVASRLGVRVRHRPALQFWLETEMRFVRPTAKGDVVITAPERLVEWFATEPASTWGAPPLVGVSRVPLLRADGTVVTRPGYDAATATWLDLPDHYDVPDAPSLADAVAAVCRLAVLIEEFPFCDAASRVNALALLLTVVGRPAIDGPVPLFVISANQAGSGKSLLSDVAAVLATGTPAPVLSLTGEVELRKAVTAFLTTAPAVAKLDNVTSRLDSATLARLLTSVSWADRVLGVSEMAFLPNRAVWIANGNNLSLGGDLRRRVVLVELNTDRPEAWSRNGWKIRDLVAHVAAHRTELVTDALVVLRAFLTLPERERPGPAVHFGGGFEEWCRLIGGALAYVEEEDFLANAARVDVHDDEAAERAVLLAAVSRFATIDAPRTSRQLIEAAAGGRGDPVTRRDLAEALAGAVGAVDDAQAPKRLGEHLNRHVDAPVYVDGGDVAVLRRRTAHGKVAAWWVERSEP